MARLHAEQGMTVILVSHLSLIHISSTVEKEIKAELENTDTVDAAAYVGTVIAKRAIEKGITEVVFDRGGFIYQGKVQALADAAREAGLKF